MDAFEFFVLLGSCFAAWKFFTAWYPPILSSWPSGRGANEKAALLLLPVIAFVMVLGTLLTLASFDVVTDVFWVFFYVALGFAWLWPGVLAMNAFFDLSMRDDILGMNNRAAMPAFSGGFLALAILYAGANVGDGPGWWCVLFAGGLGLAAWVALAMGVNALTHVFERVTVGRDAACGVRLGSYLLASGILLGRASAGDWTSAGMTVVEFASGWPVLVVALFAVAGERLFIRLADDRDTPGSFMASSVILGALLIFLAVAGAVLTPLSTGGTVLWKPE